MRQPLSCPASKRPPNSSSEVFLRLVGALGSGVRSVRPEKPCLSACGMGGLQGPARICCPLASVAILIACQPPLRSLWPVHAVANLHRAVYQKNRLRTHILRPSGAGRQNPGVVRIPITQTVVLRLGYARCFVRSVCGRMDRSSRSRVEMRRDYRFTVLTRNCAPSDDPLAGSRSEYESSA